MEENPDGMINPLTPASEEDNSILPTSEENLIQPIEHEESSDDIQTNDSFDSTSSTSSEQTEPDSADTSSSSSSSFSFPSSSSTSSDTTSTSTQTPRKKKNPYVIMSIVLAFIAISCAVTAALMFTLGPKGNSGSGNSTNNSSSTSIDSCPGCVFAYEADFNYLKGGGKFSFVPQLEDYMYSTSWTDVRNAIDENFFFGFALNNNAVDQAYVCGVVDDKPFCLENALNNIYGGTKAARTEAFAHNIETLNRVYGDKCSGIDDTKASFVTCNSNMGGDDDVIVYLQKESRLVSDGSLTQNDKAGQVCIGVVTKENFGSSPSSYLSSVSETCVDNQGNAYCNGPACYAYKQEHKK